jgi:DNA repair exonuclease SbcCD ATPase subunit
MTKTQIAGRISTLYRQAIITMGAFVQARVQASGARTCKSLTRAVDGMVCPVQAATLEATVAEKLRQAQAAYNIAIEGKLQIAANFLEEQDDRVLQLQETLEELKQLVSDTAHDLRQAKAQLKSAERYFEETEREVSKAKVTLV